MEEKVKYGRYTVSYTHLGSRLSVPGNDILEEHYRRVKAEATIERKMDGGNEDGMPEYIDYLNGEMAEGYTGVVGILDCGEGPVAALRFDIDALPMEEDTSCLLYTS